jgi:phosphohistidine phosphatase
VKLLLIRHGHAQDRALLQRDHARSLTAQGRRRVRKAARGLRALLPDLDVLAASPLARASQTAEIVARVYGHAPGVVRLPVLKPGQPPRRFWPGFGRSLRRQPWPWSATNRISAGS